MIFWVWEQWRVVRGPGISIRTLTYNRSHRGVCVRSAQVSPYTHSHAYTCADGWGKQTWQWCIATGCRCRREERDSTSHGWVGEREGCEPQERERERCSVGSGSDTPVYMLTPLHVFCPSLAFHAVCLDSYHCLSLFLLLKHSIYSEGNLLSTAVKTFLV